MLQAPRAIHVSLYVILGICGVVSLVMLLLRSAMNLPMEILEIASLRNYQTDAFERIELLNAIQQIELSVYLDSHATPYSTGSSPHYYDGPFSLTQSCRNLKFRYYCSSYVTKTHHFDEWSMSLHSEDLHNSSALQVLSALQNEWNFYNYDIQENIVTRLRSEKKIFLKPNLNILFYGNSYLKQILLGFICMLRQIDANSVNMQFNIEYCNGTETHDTIQFDKMFCLDSTIELIQFENHRRWNGLHLKNSFLHDIFRTQFTNLGVCRCYYQHATFELFNNVTLHYITAHDDANKSVFESVKEFKIDNIDFDVIVFNTGNPPHYVVADMLLYDLINLRHTEKPFIWHSAWWVNQVRANRSDSNRKVREANETIELIMKGLQPLRDKFPNLLYISSRRRRRLMNVDLIHALCERDTFPCHFCNPGLPEHHAINLLHLIDVVTSVL